MAGSAIALSAGQLSAPTARLRAEMDHARAELQFNAPEADRTAPLARLDRAKAALDAGRVYLAAYLMEVPWEGARNFALIKASADITTTDAFIRKWTAMGEPRPVPPPRGSRVPALVAALAAVAEARGPTTYHASRPYGEDSSVFGGLYYLGDSHAVMEFAAMLRGLDWPTPAAAPTFRSITGEIAALDAEMTAAYERMERANHSTYISASAALKQARTLNEHGQFAGALLEYLLSRHLFAPLRGPASANATPESIAAARAALSAQSDHSIAELFLQLAEEGVAGSVDAQRRGAAEALEDVMPAYKSALAAPATTTTGSATAAVTITLVRWPYT